MSQTGKKMETSGEAKNEWWTCVLSVGRGDSVPFIYNFVRTEQIDNVVEKFNGKYYTSSESSHDDDDGDDLWDPCCNVSHYLEYKVYKIPISEYKKLMKKYILVDTFTGSLYDSVNLIFLQSTNLDVPLLEIQNDIYEVC